MATWGALLRGAFPQHRCRSVRSWQTLTVKNVGLSNMETYLDVQLLVCMRRLKSRTDKLLSEHCMSRNITIYINQRPFRSKTKRNETKREPGEPFDPGSTITLFCRRDFRRYLRWKRRELANQDKERRREEQTKWVKSPCPLYRFIKTRFLSCRIELECCYRLLKGDWR